MKSVCVGTSGWAYASWKPDFYPPKTPASKFLDYYATQLNCVEVNFTFRQRPTPKTLQNWIDCTPADFSFVTKAHQRITHIKRLKDVGADVTGFFESLEPLSKAGKLGPVLFQLPPHLKCDVDRLRAFLQLIPSGKRTAIEFRHESWWKDEVFDLMRQSDVALCIAESDELQSPEVHTASFAYYRFRKSDYAEADISAMSQRLKKVADARDIYVFMKHEETPAGALNAHILLNNLRASQRPQQVA